MNWRRFNLIEYRKGRYRLERKSWSFWDWCLMLFIVSVVLTFWEYVLIAIAAFGLAIIIPTVIGGIVLAIVSLKR